MDETQSGEVILVKPPMSIEQSRTQRLERQQARFRDRGGIFIPSNRNTLVDMLLGRKAASPRKSQRYALSSPKKHTGHRENGIDNRRSSPRKMARKSAGFKNATAVSSSLPAAAVRSEEQLVNSHTITKKNAKGKAKSEGETGKKRRKATSTAHDDEPLRIVKVDESPAKAKTRRKPTAKGAKKNTAKKSESIGAHMIEETCEDQPPEIPPKPKAKGKGKKTSNTRASDTANDPDHDSNEMQIAHTTNARSKAPKSKSKVGGGHEGAEESRKSKPPASTPKERKSQVKCGNSAALRTQKQVPSPPVLVPNGTRSREVEESKPADSGGSPISNRKRSRTDSEIGPSSKRVKGLLVGDQLPRGETGPQAQPSKRATTPDDAPKTDDEGEIAVLPVKSRKRPRAPGKETKDRRKRGKVDTENPADDSDVDKKGSGRAAKKTTKASRSTKKSNKKSSATSIHDLNVRLKLKPRKSVMQRIKGPLPDMEDDEPDPLDCLC